MGSGEGYGIAVECTRDSGLELETVGKAVWVLAVNGEGTGWVAGFKRKEWGRGKTGPPSLALFSFHL
ncbi:hypothetical protein Tco_1450135 [Tanacetum coccineum]